MSGSTSILRNEKFISLWLGQLLSQMGTRIYSLALSWWIITQAGHQAGLKMGILLVLGSLPGVLFAKKIGSIVDADEGYPGNLKGILLLSDGAALGAISLFGIWVWLGTPNLTLIYFIGFFLAFCGAWIEPVLQKSVPLFVGERRVSEAVALLASTTSFASFVGAAFGAVLVEAFGLNGSVLVNAMSYLLALAFTARVVWPSVSAPPLAAATKTTGGDEQSLLNAFRPLLLSFGFINFFSTPTLLVIPLFIKFQIGGNASDLAIAESGLWMGFVLGGFLARKEDPRENLLQSGALGLLGLGIGLLASAFASTTVIYALGLGFSGVSLGFGNTKFLSHFQRVVPHQFKGRFFSLLSAVSSFTFPISFLVFGFLADLIPLPWICSLQGLGVMLLFFWSFSLSKQVRRAWT